MTISSSKFAALDKVADKVQSIFDKGNAKDDSVGSSGSYTFTIAELLQNDVNAKANTFFFGDGLDAFKQAKYMADHGITYNGNGTYTATAGMDFSYSVLTGKGLCLSYSEGDVDVKDAPHLSGTELLQNWNFEQDNANNANGFVIVAASQVGITRPVLHRRCKSSTRTSASLRLRGR